MQLSLFLFDRDLPHAASPSHQHAGISHVWHHVQSAVGLPDHKGGVCLLIVAAVLHTGFARAFKRMAVEMGGAKRVNAAVHVCAAAVALPAALVAWAALPAVINDRIVTRLADSVGIRRR